MTIQKEDTKSLDDCNNIIVDFSNEEINLVTVDDEDFKVIQESSKELKDEEKFTMSKSGDTITVQKNNFNNIHIGFFQDSGFQKIQLFLPKKYTKSLKIKTSSGDININSPLSLSDVDFSVSSGHINSSDNIQATNKSSFKSTSGDLNLKGILAKESSYSASSGQINLAGTISSEKTQIKTTSGEIKVNELMGNYDIKTSSGYIRIKSLLVGSGNIEATSGDINVDYKDMGDYSNIKSSSGSVHANIDKNVSFEFEGKCSSGKIDTNFDLNYKTKRGNEVNGKVGDSPYRKLTITTTSGDINIKRN